MSKILPATDPLWAESASPTDVADPSAALRANGYPFEDPLPNNEFNAILQRLGRHVDALGRTWGASDNSASRYAGLAYGESTWLDDYSREDGIGAVRATANPFTAASSNTVILRVETDGVYVYLTGWDATAGEVEIATASVETLDIEDSTVFNINNDVAFQGNGQQAVAAFDDGTDTLIYVYDDPEDLSAPSTQYTLNGYVGAYATLDQTHIYFGDFGDTFYKAVDLSDGTVTDITLDSGETVPSSTVNSAFSESGTQAESPHVVLMATSGPGQAGQIFRRTNDNTWSFVRAIEFGTDALRIAGNGRWTVSIDSDTGADTHEASLFQYLGGGDFSTQQRYVDLGGNNELVMNSRYYASRSLNQVQLANLEGGNFEYIVSTSLSTNPHSGPSPRDLNNFANIALNETGLYIIGEPASDSDPCIFRLQLPPARAVKGWSPTGLALGG